MDEMNAAIYARYSSDAQNPRSLDDQVYECKACASNRGWVVDSQHIYLDAALSGADTNRPAYLQLKRAALDGQFEHIVVDDLSRLGRDMAESATIFRELTELGVSLVAVADGIDTSNPSAKIPFYFKGMMNEMFLDDMKAKIVRGLKGQVLRGYSPGGRVYGYKTKQILDPSGATDKFGRPKRLGCEVMIDQKQAKIVQHIFEMKVAGLGYRTIADHLNQKNEPSPHSGCGQRAGFWSRSTIRSIILQRKYMGDWTWNKTRWLKRTQGSTRIKKDRPPSEWVRFQSEALRIISDELWQSVHSKAIKSRQPKPGPRGRYLLSGLLKCDRCGASLVIQNSGISSVYICGGYRNGGTSVCSNNHRLSRFVLEGSFCEELRQILVSPTLLEDLASRVKKSIRERLATGQSQEKDMRRRRRQIDGRLNNLVGLVETGDVSKAISRRILELEREIETIDTNLARTSHSPGSLPTIALGTVEAKLKDLCRLLNAPDGTPGVQKQAIKNLFPDRLSVVQEEAKNDVIFKVSGNVHPFNGLLLPTSLMSYSGAGT
jgi:DNA invertase Pin-like site-specific DNA recombinase